MNLPASLFSTSWHVFMTALTAVVFFWIVRTTPWKRVVDGAQLNVLLGFSVVLMLAWSMKAGVKPGLNLHMLGAMAGTLMLGPRRALIALAIALTGITLNGAVEWQAWPINFILMAVIPVGIANLLHHLIQRKLPNHFFVFIFVTSFAGAALTVMLQGAVSSTAMIAAGAYQAEFLLSDYLPFFLLLGFAEAWISGAMVTLFVVYRPEWVSGFDDNRYLVNK